jgi:hypothetical protein
VSWQDYLTDAERARIGAIPAERDTLTGEYRTIYNRARQRERRANADQSRAISEVLNPSLAKPMKGKPNAK